MDTLPLKVSQIFKNGWERQWNIDDTDYCRLRSLMKAMRAANNQIYFGNDGASWYVEYHYTRYPLGEYIEEVVESLTKTGLLVDDVGLSMEFDFEIQEEGDWLRLCQKESSRILS